MRLDRLAAASVAAWLGLSGCAALFIDTDQPPQAIEVLLDSDEPAIMAEGLQCRAINDAGRWSFRAPGTVTVVPVVTRLSVSCEVPGESGRRQIDVVRAEGSQAATTDKAAKAGAVVGGSVGVGLGSAAVGLAGAAAWPAALVLAFGGLATGHVLGEAIGVVAAERSAEGVPRYPSPITIRIRKSAP